MSTTTATTATPTPAFSRELATKPSTTETAALDTESSGFPASPAVNAPLARLGHKIGHNNDDSGAEPASKPAASSLPFWVVVTTRPGGPGALVALDELATLLTCRQALDAVLGDLDTAPALDAAPRNTGRNAA